MSTYTVNVIAKTFEGSFDTKLIFLHRNLVFNVNRNGSWVEGLSFNNGFTKTYPTHVNRRIHICVCVFVNVHVYVCHRQIPLV